MHLLKFIITIIIVALLSACGGDSSDDSTNNENDMETLDSTNDRSSGSEENIIQNSTIDKSAPIITISGDNPQEIIQGETFSDSGATATDNIDGEVAVIPSGQVDMSTVGEYTITYRAKDQAGNEATATRTVKVKSANVVWNVSNVTEFRQALENASANGKNDKIVLSAGIYKTTSDGLGTFDFNDNEPFDLTIESAKGLTYQDVVLDGDGIDSVFDFDNNKITKDAILTFKAISVINGKTDSKKAGGIHSMVNTKIEDCNISGNIGGGLYSFGYNTTINNSIISDNKSTQAGGGFYSWAQHNNWETYYGKGKTTINNSKIINNQSSQGGGFFAGGKLIINNSIISNNKAIELLSENYRGEGGGFYSEGMSVTITNSIISDNQSHFGGGFSSDAQTTITNSSISNNSANSRGGGFYVGHVTITDSNISNNQVLAAGTSYEGGGFYATGATITNSNISNNSIRKINIDFPIGAFGGGFYAGRATITNSTISNNSGGSGFSCFGYSNSELNIVNNSVISNNTDKDNIEKAFQIRGKLILTNSIISNSQNGFSTSSFAYVSNNNFINITDKAIISKGVFVNNIFDSNNIDISLTAGKIYNNYIEYSKISYGENNNVIKKQNLQPSSVGDIYLNSDNTLDIDSPVIDKGLNPSSATFKKLINNNEIYNQMVELLTTDKVGNRRVHNGTIDMGAVEYGSSE